VARPAVRTAVLLGLTVAAGSVSQRAPSRRDGWRVAPWANVVAAGAAVALARRWGATWDELGLAPAQARRGVRAGIKAAAPVALAIGAAAALPATRAWFADARVVELDATTAARELFVRIPLATAAAEEVLFRGALPAVAADWIGTPGATALSSAAFGVWHVLPALESHQHHAHGAAVAERVGGRAANVAVTVAATAAAGAALLALRRRAGSVLAPALAHATVNGLAFACARRIDQRARSSG